MYLEKSQEYLAHPGLLGGDFCQSLLLMESTGKKSQLLIEHTRSSLVNTEPCFLKNGTFYYNLLIKFEFSIKKSQNILKGPQNVEFRFFD